MQYHVYSYLPSQRHCGKVNFLPGESIEWFGPVFKINAGRLNRVEAIICQKQNLNW